MVTKTGEAHCWGDNFAGQLGDGTTKERRTPAPVAGLTDVVQMDQDGMFGCAVRKSGKVACWGPSKFSKLGAPAKAEDVSTPVEVVGLDDAVSVDTTTRSACAIKRDGSVVCWGNFDPGNGPEPPYNSVGALPVEGLTGARLLQLRDESARVIARRGPYFAPLAVRARRTASRLFSAHTASTPIGPSRLRPSFVSE